MEEAGAAIYPARARPRRPRAAASAEDQLRVTRRSLGVVLEKCRRALQSLDNVHPDPNIPAADVPEDEGDAKETPAGNGEGSPSRSQSVADSDVDELYALLRSKVESPNFTENLGNIQTSVFQSAHDDIASWDMVTSNDLWEDKHVDGENDSDDYVLVRQEDIVDGIACFMAAYLLSLKQTKEFTPNQLQYALCKTFSVKKKSRLRKAWDGSKVMYNVASWGATAIGIYQNPAILKAASVAFCSSCRVLSKLF